MKLTYIFLFALLPTFFLNAQVGIGTTNPNASLDIRSTNQASPVNTDGMLIPKIDEYPATNPTVSQDGMLVYATGDGSVSKGFYYWDNGAANWVSFSGSIGAEKINDLIDGKSDNDGTQDGSSVFLGMGSGLNDDGTNNGNVGVGYQSLHSNTTGSANTANGSFALNSNTTGNFNTATGTQSLIRNTTGTFNMANGSFSLFFNTTGSHNTANGGYSLHFNTTGSHNTATGYEALYSNTTGNQNTVNGYKALYYNTTGSFNIANGVEALHSNTTGNGNVANGYQTLRSNTIGIENVANGRHAMYSNTEGNRNTALGYNSLRKNTVGDYNIAIGNDAGYFAQGSRNVFLGNSAGAGTVNHTINNSVFLGNQAGYDETNSNRLYIENSSSTTPLIYGEFDNDLLRVNGDFEVEKTTDVSIIAKTPFGNKSSLKLFETNGSSDYGFEFEYDGSPDKLYLWSRTFSGNEGIRMTWLKNGRVGISTTAPNALLDVSSTNPAAPKNTDGMLVPRIDAFPSSNPTASQNGMLVFLTIDDTFYYWRNSTTSWVSSGVQKINDLLDAKSDNDGSQNGSSIYLGMNAGLNDDSSDNRNVGVGYQALYSNTTGYNNSANGYQTLFGNTEGNYNTSNGHQALYSNTTGGVNTANGAGALYRNTTGIKNTANGASALFFNTTGESNTANGAFSLRGNTTGIRNTANGHDALFSNTTGANNTANGYGALYNNTTGDKNVAIGQSSLLSNTINNNNTAIGANSDVAAGYSNATALGYMAVAGASNQVRIGNSSVAVIGGNAPWSNFSDKRIKINIKEDIKGLEFIKKLRPVSYNLDMDAIARYEKTPDSLRLKDAERLKAREIQTGFIAQEVELAAKEVGFNFHGVVKPYTSDALYAIRYAEFVVPLVKAVQEQQTQIEALKKEIQEIKALLLKN